MTDRFSSDHMSASDWAEVNKLLAPKPVPQQVWADFKRGDRVNHFDYGDGTVRCVDALIMFITWDDPTVGTEHHTTAIAYFLTRIDPV